MWIQVAKLTAIAGPIALFVVWLVSHRAPDPFPGAKRQWRTLFLISATAGMTGMLALTALLEGYNHPIKPSPETNRIYAYNMHGKAIYLTKEEDSALHFFEIMSFSAVLGCLVTVYFMQKRQ
jgi:hypothetical protein